MHNLNNNTKGHATQQYQFHPDIPRITHDTAVSLLDHHCALPVHATICKSMTQIDRNQTVNTPQLHAATGPAD